MDTPRMGSGEPRGYARESVPGRAISPARTGAVRQEALRAHNLALVLRRIVGASRPPSRADIAAATGMNRTTASALVDRLVAGGLVAERAPTASSGAAGRPATPLVPAGRTLAAIGVELNVDYLALTAIDLGGERLAMAEIPGDFRRASPREALAAVVERTMAAARDLRAQGLRLAGVGLALPGLIDRDSGPLRLAPNLRWRDVDVLGTCRELGLDPDLELQLSNEAKAGCRAELQAAGRQYGQDFVYVSGEVGIGAAICLDGQILRGSSGWSGELGHVTVAPGGRTCTCGADGCLEAYAGLDAIADAAGLGRPAGAPRASSADLVRELEAGRESVLSAVDDAADKLGIALSACLNIVDVPWVVLGGTYRSLAPWLTKSIDSQLATRVLAAPWSHPRSRPAVIGRAAAVLGAAQARLDTVLDDPTPWLG